MKLRDDVEVQDVLPFLAVTMMMCTMAFHSSLISLKLSHSIHSSSFWLLVVVPSIVSSSSSSSSCLCRTSCRSSSQLEDTARLSYFENPCQKEMGFMRFVPLSAVLSHSCLFLLHFLSVLWPIPSIL